MERLGIFLSSQGYIEGQSFYRGEARYFFKSHSIYRGGTLRIFPSPRVYIAGLFLYIFHIFLHIPSCFLLISSYSIIFSTCYVIFFHIFHMRILSLLYFVHISSYFLLNISHVFLDIPSYFFIFSTYSFIFPQIFMSSVDGGGGKGDDTQTSGLPPPQAEIILKSHLLRLPMVILLRPDF